MSVIDEVFDKAHAIEQRWRYRAGVRFQWRIGHGAFDAIVIASAPPAPRGLHDVDPEFAVLSAKQETYASDVIRRGKEAWGKKSSTLIGWPIVCDETFDGIEAEVVSPALTVP